MRSLQIFILCGEDGLMGDNTKIVFFNHRGTQRHTEVFFNTEEKPECTETTEIWVNVHFCPFRDYLLVETLPHQPFVPLGTIYWLDYKKMRFYQ